MTFTLISPSLTFTAEEALKAATKRYGKRGLQMEKAISDDIRWRPTFFMKPTKTHLVAFEVSDAIYPTILELAALSVLRFDSIPISAYAVCPLGQYIADAKQKEVRRLQSHGFGLYTVDEDGDMVLQVPCVPLVQHISEQAFESQTKKRPLKYKIGFRSAYKSYMATPIQGVQEGAKVVEATIECLASHCKKRGWINGGLPQAAANKVDTLFNLTQMKPHRAALGGTRSFLKSHRNPTSHPAKSGKDAFRVFSSSQEGFQASIKIALELVAVAKSESIRLTLHI